MLGICNGFQALIKLGLVPFGKITDSTENSPTLTYNKIGRHASCLVRTGIASVKSPWLAGVEVGDIFTIPVSTEREDSLQMISFGYACKERADSNSVC